MPLSRLSMTEPQTSGLSVPERIGQYRIVRQLGRGGMGVVFEAVDERLQRGVAIKKILQTADSHVRDRFLREARAAAAVSHPHICQIFEIGEHEGEPFLALELLEGQTLADRLAGGAMPAGESVATLLAVLSALEALHRRGIVHRDLKPSNIFLTPHGVKLLDFGLARPVAVEVETTSITLPGVVLGTPRYMAPEQARGQEIDARADLFAAGAILFEMLSGRPAFHGPSGVEVLHAVMHEHPPALVGSLLVVAADRVIQRALAKAAADRYQAADEMARELRACLSHADAGGPAVARATTRLIVLPFRILRSDPDIEFLAFSLPDAITVALSGLESLVVRSSLAAGRLGEIDADWLARAREANIDAAVVGTLLHASGLLRVNVQLVESSAGTVLWSHALQVPLDDLFKVQDAVCSAVVEALALPLTSREQRQLRRDVPANAAAYGSYLRANRLSVTASQWPLAREHYLQAVEADPSYAPAWARLGRCLRVMGKYGRGEDAPRLLADAEAAFRHAFELNPDLSLAHNLYTHVEVDQGRAIDAVVRLLGRLRERTGDPDLFAGLVHACRYVGLLDASLAAYDRARRLDPSIRTSVAHTFYMRGEFTRAIEADNEEPPYVSVSAFLSLGRPDEALALCRAARIRAPLNEHLRAVLDALVASVEGQHEAGRREVEQLEAYEGFTDPEGYFYWAQAAMRVDDHERARRLLERSVDGGFLCVQGLETSPAFDDLRLDPGFVAVAERARRKQARAAAVFAQAEGPRLLGLPAP
ncbi:MAG TPA: protein kinase [Vicinamibacterales bacterium]|nr:protein kinase [Vicinamibacterales bacterium]